MLKDELAFLYDAYGVQYLAGLQPQKKRHRDLLTQVPECQFYAQPLTDERGPGGYWGTPCAVPFEYENEQIFHRGLVVLSGPMRTALRHDRADKIRTFYEEAGQIRLRWQVDGIALWRDMQRDGRYLLVTNDPSLTPRHMLRHYRSKDGVEKRFTICKQDLRVSPVYLHQDQRIEAMLLMNMTRQAHWTAAQSSTVPHSVIALLAYSLLERHAQRARQRGLNLTTRRLIAQLSTMTLIETHCWDGSVLYRLTPIDQRQYELWIVLRDILVVEQVTPTTAAPVAGLPPSAQWAIAPPSASPPSLAV